MASWMKSGKEFSALLMEAAQIDTDITAALGNPESFGDGLELMRAVADQCFQELYDVEGESVDQRLEVDLNYMTWTRKGKPLVHEGRRIYGEREPGFFLRIGQQPEKVAKGPKEWTPNKVRLIYNFLLTVSREKGTREMKRVAADLGWELVSG